MDKATLLKTFRAKLKAIQTKTNLPWEVDSPDSGFGYALVAPEMFGEGKCSYCSDEGATPPIHTSEPNSEGKIHHTHRVSYLVPSEDDGHIIYDAIGRKVAGNYDWEAGAIVEPSMAKLLVWMVNNLPNLLDSIDKKE